MLSLLGFLTIFAFLTLIMTKRLSVHVALIVFPALAAVIGAAVTGTYAYSAIGKMMLDGLLRVAPVGIMIAFAILFFGLMLDVGLFDPLIKGLVRLLKGDPVKVAVGAFALTVLVALDGDGATTFMITCSAMVPIFKRLNMRPVALSGIVCLGAGAMNIIPWGGPTARALASLHVESSALFTPVLPAMVIGVLWGGFCAFLIGRSERKRLGIMAGKPPQSLIGGQAQRRGSVPPQAQPVLVQPDPDRGGDRNPDLGLAAPCGYLHAGRCPCDAGEFSQG